jgi:glutathione S-transferase
LPELDIPYEVFPISLSTNNQKTAQFLAMNRNGRMPVIKDNENDDLTIFEPAAIMIYLAEKTG